jgi:DNA-binding transcriptional LysR family regulator
MFDWNDLKHFLAIARHGSTIAAGKALGVNQSTVHRRLAELERRLGRELVKRHPTGYRLTELGKILRPEAERVEDAVAAFARRAAAFTTEIAGTVRVTCPEALGSRLVRSQLIEKFNARYPGLRVELVMSDTFVDLSKDEADIAFRAAASTDRTLFGRKISPSPWALYASRGYVERRGGIGGVEDIDRHAVVSFDGSLREHPAARWLQATAPNARVTARGTTLPALLMAVKSGAGITALPMIVGDDDDELVRLFGPIPNLPTDIYLYMHEDMKGTPRVRAFFDFVIEELAAVRAILTAPPRQQGDMPTPGSGKGGRRVLDNKQD